MQCYTGVEQTLISLGVHINMVSVVFISVVLCVYVSYFQFTHERIQCIIIYRWDDTKWRIYLMAIEMRYAFTLRMIYQIYIGMNCEVEYVNNAIE